MRIKLWVIVLAVIVSFLIVILLWPLRSNRFKIKYNEKAIAEKINFLKQTSHNKPEILPNIILITVDDLGMADCSLYGEGNIKTPNIDRLGAEGVVFENAYTTSPVCAPARAAMITGRYQHRFGFEFTIHERYLSNRLEYLGFEYFVKSYPWSARWMPDTPDESAIEQQGLPLSEVTLSELLKKQGYRTGIIGKWHLGYDASHLPSNFGFDEQFGFFSSHSLYAYEDTKGIADQKIKTDWTDSHIWEGQRNNEHGIYKNNILIREEKYLTDRITEESVSFINSAGQKPYFLWISYNAPHTPLQAPEVYIEKFSNIKDPVKRTYAAMIACLDDNIGMLTNYLQKNGKNENTLIFFISDNGGAEYATVTDNGRYAGGKNTEFEGGVKVPMIAKWEGVLNSGQRYQPMVSAMDIFSTSIAAARCEPLPGREIDGINLLPFLHDSVYGNPHEYLFWQRGISKALRTNHWKLIFNDKTGDQALYHLSQDKYEDNDHAAKMPELVSQLKNAHANWRQTHTKPLWPAVVYYVAEKDGKQFYFEQ